MNNDQFEYLRICPLDPVQFIERHSRATPHAWAIVHPGGGYTYKALIEIIDRVAAEFHVAGLRQGNTVSINLSNFFFGLISSLALARLGCACVLGLRERNTDVVVLDAAITMDSLATGGVRQIEFRKEWLSAGRGAELAPSIPRGFKSLESIAVFTSSSGSTGQPKLISSTLARFHKTVIDSLFHKHHRPAASPCLISIWLGTLWSYRQINTILWTGGTLIFGADHDSTARQLKSFGVRQIAVSVFQLAIWAKIARKFPEYFSTVDTVTTGGSKLTPKLEDTVRQYITPDIYVNYGSTETGLIAAGNVDLQRKHPNAAGVVLDTVTVEIVDSSGKVLPQGVSGTVRVRTGSMIEGSAKDGFKQGWFYTRDEGILNEDRVLSVFGRGDGVTNIGGMKIQLDDCEELLRECPGIEDTALFLVHNEFEIPELRCAFVPGKNFHEAEFSRQLAKLPSVPVTIEVGAIPRSAEGKVLRHVLEDAYKIPRAM